MRLSRAASGRHVDQNLALGGAIAERLEGFRHMAEADRVGDQRLRTEGLERRQRVDGHGELDHVEEGRHHDGDFLVQDGEGIPFVATDTQADADHLALHAHEFACEIDQALHAHSQALKYNSRGSGDGFAGFADQFFDQRLNFYISAGRGSDIIAALQQVALERLDDPDVYWAIGHAYNKNDNSEKAIEYFERALALGDTSADTLRELANIYLGQSAFEQASPLYEQLIQINPGDVEAHSALAFMYAQQGQLDKAIEHNQMVLQQMPNDYDSLKNLAILYKQQGQLQQAFDVAQQAQAAAPENEQPSWEQFIADLESQIAESS